MPRSNRVRRGGRRAGRAAESEDLDVGRALAGQERLESHADGEWYVRPVNGGVSAKPYRCPGCQQEIPPGSRSGRLKFQGGQILFIVEGRGHTMLDGVKHAWEAGDVVNQLRWLSSLGIQTVLGWVVGVDRIDPIEVMGREVIPAVADL